MDIEELRKAHRFVAVQPINATFGPGEAALLNLSLRGAQIAHAQPIRIGTVTKLAFRITEVAVAIQARVVWSHLAPTTGGKPTYRSGIRIEAEDPKYAMAINSLLRAGAVRQDLDSLRKKREREVLRDEKRRTAVKSIPSAGKPE